MPNDEPPTMPDPPEEADDALPSIAAGGLFGEDEETPRQRRASEEPMAPPLPPPGASPLVTLILEGVQNPKARRAIEEAVWYLNDGREDHLLTRAAALFSVIGQVQETRQITILSEIRRAMERGGSPSPQQPQAAAPAFAPEELQTFGRGLGEAIVEGQMGEFLQLRKATQSVNNQRVLAFVAGAFFAGMALSAILFLIFQK